MEIKHNDNGEKGAFYIEVNGKSVAEMTYVWAGTDRIIIDHTGVGEILKGKGAGKLMLAEAVKFARSKGIKIVPLCPFAKSVFDKTPEYNDVL
ncbi:MAG: N-acetyltransferase [Bacteroidetes bacterium]|nr:N-acetyltransferase [Bacteroidota bacterium]